MKAQSEQKTAEEILLSKDVIFKHGGRTIVYNDLNFEDILEAMEEYASQFKPQLPIEQKQEHPSFYKLIASLVTTYQMSPEDWNLGPMSKRNQRAISRQVGDHNDRLKTLAIDLKKVFESMKSQPLPIEGVNKKDNESI